MATSVWIRWAMQRDGRRRPTDPAAIEAEVAAALKAGDPDEAALVALEGWGREVLGMLLLLLGDQARATAAFGTVERWARCQIEAPSWPGSTRVWLHILAKRAAHEAPPVPEATPTPPCTPTWPSTSAASPLVLPDLRGALEPDDELRLVLRIRRRFSWREVAAIVEGVDPHDEVALDQAARRQRRLHREAEGRLRALHRRRRRERS